MKKLIGYIMAVVLFTACSKQKNESYTLKGRFMQSCDSPAANKYGIIHFPGGGLLSKPSTKLEFTTDENGYFEVTHNSPFTEFSVRTSDAHSVLRVDSIPGDNNHLGEVYIFQPNTQFYINLQVENNYTDQDTLYYPDYNSSSGFSWRKVPGPFANGIIDTVHNSFNSSAMPVEFNSSEPAQSSIRYYLNEPIHENEKETKFFTSHCQDEYQEVTLKIE